MSTVTNALRSAAQGQAQSILSDVNGVAAVVIATVDGFDIASAVTGGTDPARVAAMASSISALGAVVSQEAGLGRSRSVTITTEAGFAFVSTVHRNDVSLVVNVIGGERAILAQVVYRCGECVRALEAA
jgi:uncharacterized protein